jgi:hypothetical protein
VGGRGNNEEGAKDKKDATHECEEWEGSIRETRRINLEGKMAAVQVVERPRWRKPEKREDGRGRSGCPGF